MYNKYNNIATTRNVSEFRFEGWGVSKTIYAILRDESDGTDYYLKISTKRPWFLRMGYSTSGFTTINGSHIRVGVMKEYVF